MQFQNQLHNVTGASDHSSCIAELGRRRPRHKFETGSRPTDVVMLAQMQDEKNYAWFQHLIKSQELDDIENVDST